MPVEDKKTDCSASKSHVESSTPATIKTACFSVSSESDDDHFVTILENVNSNNKKDKDFLLDPNSPRRPGHAQQILDIGFQASRSKSRSASRKILTSSTEDNTSVLYGIDSTTTTTSTYGHYYIQDNHKKRKKSKSSVSQVGKNNNTTEEDISLESGSAEEQYMNAATNDKIHFQKEMTTSTEYNSKVESSESNVGSSEEKAAISVTFTTQETTNITETDNNPAMKNAESAHNAFEQANKISITSLPTVASSQMTQRLQNTATANDESEPELNFKMERQAFQQALDTSSIDQTLTTLSESTRTNHDQNCLKLQKSQNAIEKTKKSISVSSSSALNIEKQTTSAASDLPGVDVTNKSGNYSSMLGKMPTSVCETISPSLERDSSLATLTKQSSTADVSASYRSGKYSEKANIQDSQQKSSQVTDRLEFSQDLEADTRESDVSEGTSFKKHSKTKALTEQKSKSSISSVEKLKSIPEKNKSETSKAGKIEPTSKRKSKEKKNSKETEIQMDDEHLKQADPNKKNIATISEDNSSTEGTESGREAISKSDTLNKSEATEASRNSNTEGAEGEASNLQKNVVNQPNTTEINSKASVTKKYKQDNEFEGNSLTGKPTMSPDASATDKVAAKDKKLKRQNETADAPNKPKDDKKRTLDTLKSKKDSENSGSKIRVSAEKQSSSKKEDNTRDTETMQMTNIKVNEEGANEDTASATNKSRIMVNSSKHGSDVHDVKDSDVGRRGNSQQETNTADKNFESSEIGNGEGKPSVTSTSSIISKTSKDSDKMETKIRDSFSKTSNKSSGKLDTESTDSKPKTQKKLAEEKHSGIKTSKSITVKTNGRKKESTESKNDKESTKLRKSADTDEKTKELSGKSRHTVEHKLEEIQELDETDTSPDKQSSDALEQSQESQEINEATENKKPSMTGSKESKTKKDKVKSIAKKKSSHVPKATLQHEDVQEKQDEEVDVKLIRQSENLDREYQLDDEEMMHRQGQHHSTAAVEHRRSSSAMGSKMNSFVRLVDERASNMSDKHVVGQKENDSTSGQRYSNTPKEAKNSDVSNTDKDKPPNMLSDTLTTEDKESTTAGNEQQRTTSTTMDKKSSEKDITKSPNKKTSLAKSNSQKGVRKGQSTLQPTTAATEQLRTTSTTMEGKKTSDMELETKPTSPEITETIDSENVKRSQNSKKYSQKKKASDENRLATNVSDGSKTSEQDVGLTLTSSPKDEKVSGSESLELRRSSKSRRSDTAKNSKRKSSESMRKEKKMDQESVKQKMLAKVNGARSSTTLTNQKSVPTVSSLETVETLVNNKINESTNPSAAAAEQQRTTSTTIEGKKSSSSSNKMATKPQGTLGSKTSKQSGGKRSSGIPENSKRASKARYEESDKNQASDSGPSTPEQCRSVDSSSVKNFTDIPEVRESFEVTNEEVTKVGKQHVGSKPNSADMQQSSDADKLTSTAKSSVLEKVGCTEKKKSLDSDKQRTSAAIDVTLAEDQQTSDVKKSESDGVTPSMNAIVEVPAELSAALEHTESDHEGYSEAADIFTAELDQDTSDYIPGFPSPGPIKLRPSTMLKSVSSEDEEIDPKKDRPLTKAETEEILRKFDASLIPYKPVTERLNATSRYKSKRRSLEFGAAERAAYLQGAKGMKFVGSDQKKGILNYLLFKPEEFYKETEEDRRRHEEAIAMAAQAEARAAMMSHDKDDRRSKRTDESGRDSQFTDTSETEDLLLRTSEDFVDSEQRTSEMARETTRSSTGTFASDIDIRRSTDITSSERRSYGIDTEDNMEGFYIHHDKMGSSEMDYKKKKRSSSTSSDKRKIGARKFASRPRRKPKAKVQTKSSSGTSGTLGETITLTTDGTATSEEAARLEGRDTEGKMREQGKPGTLTKRDNDNFLPASDKDTIREAYRNDGETERDQYHSRHDNVNDDRNLAKSTGKTEGVHQSELSKESEDEITRVDDMSSSDKGLNFRITADDEVDSADDSIRKQEPVAKKKEALDEDLMRLSREINNFKLQNAYLAHLLKDNTGTTEKHREGLEDGGLRFHRSSGLKSYDGGQSFPDGQMVGLLYKAIIQYYASRSEAVMRRNYTDLQFTPGHGDDTSKEMSNHPDDPITYHIPKEGVTIGNLDAFTKTVTMEYLLPFRDDAIQSFLDSSGILRSAATRTKCMIELTRRVLNRKVCVGGRWIKHLIVSIHGPSYKCIATCDALLQKNLPRYTQRRVYTNASHCTVFIKEELVDNTSLYHNNQRTGATNNQFGAISITAPHCAGDNNRKTPWRDGLQTHGRNRFKTGLTNQVNKFLYPSQGHNTTQPVDVNCTDKNIIEDTIQKLNKRYINENRCRKTYMKSVGIPIYR